jgi:O-antigen/teichoic acid export membrane protein
MFPERRAVRTSAARLAAIARGPSGIVLAGTLVQGALGLAIATGLARLLTTGERADIAVIQVFMSLVYVIASVGLSDAVAYRIASRQSSPATAMTATLLAMVLSPPLALIGWLLSIPLYRGRGGSFDENMMWHLMAVPATLFVSISIGFYRGKGDVVRWVSLRIAGFCIWIPCLVIAFLSGQSRRPTVLLSTYSLGSLLLAAYAFADLRRRVGPAITERHEVMALLRFGVPVALQGLPYWLNSRLDQLLLDRFISPERLSHYVVAVGWSGSVSMVLLGAASLVAPAVAAATPQLRAREARVRLIRQVQIAVSVIVAAEVITFAMFVRLFGERYRPALGLAAALVAINGILGCNYAVSECLRGFGRPFRAVVAEMFGLGATVTTLLLTVHSLNAWAGAWASLVGYSTGIGIMLLQLRHISRRFAESQDTAPATNSAR